MDKTKKNETELEELVFKVFLKHVKLNKLYTQFRWSVHHQRADKDVIHLLSPRIWGEKYYESINNISRIGCSFIAAKSVDEILNIMKGMHDGNRDVVNDGKFQMLVMSMVNGLIHSCIEHAMSHEIQMLEKLGHDIFEEVGKKLFGDEFVDKTEEAIDPRQKEFMQKMAEYGGGVMPQHLDKEFLKRCRSLMHDRLAGEYNDIVPQSVNTYTIGNYQQQATNGIFYAPYIPSWIDEYEPERIERYYNG